jgi:non-homologous end joining protein Ku
LNPGLFGCVFGVFHAPREVSKEELENVALESTRMIEIGEFVIKADIDARYIIRPYYVRPATMIIHTVTIS